MPPPRAAAAAATAAAAAGQLELHIPQGRRTSAFTLKGPPARMSVRMSGETLADALSLVKLVLAAREYHSLGAFTGERTCMARLRSWADWQAPSWQASAGEVMVAGAQVSMRGGGRRGRPRHYCWIGLLARSHAAGWGGDAVAGFEL
jgi:hypothetical protein